jgi:hypothetical protein
MTETTTTRPCCEEGAAAARVTRRSLLRALGIGATAAAASPLVSMQAAFAADPGWAGDTIVVLSLRGGFDGLSAIAPVGDPDYARHRPGIAVPAGAALQLDSTFGMHPALAPLKAVYDVGDLAIVNATGLPTPNRSHFAAMDEVERAAPGTSARTGWLNRTLGLHADGGPFAAVQLGSSSIPYALLGEKQVLGMSSVDGFKLSGADNATRRTQWRTALNSLHSASPAPMAAAASTTLGALDTAAALGATTYVPANGATYPNTDLGRALRDTARLIKGDVGTRIVTIDEGDWDMHADLGRVDGGWMRDKLVELWRWRWDLNPRRACTLTRFRGVLLRPLGHATADEGTCRRAAAISESPTIPLHVIITAANTVSRARVAVSGPPATMSVTMSPTSMTVTATARVSDPNGSPTRAAMTSAWCTAARTTPASTRAAATAAVTGRSRPQVAASTTSPTIGPITGREDHRDAVPVPGAMTPSWRSGARTAGRGSSGTDDEGAQHDHEPHQRHRQRERLGRAAVGREPAAPDGCVRGRIAAPARGRCRGAGQQEHHAHRDTGRQVGGELQDRQSDRDEGEARAHPGQQCALVGEQEPHVHVEALGIVPVDGHPAESGTWSRPRRGRSGPAASLGARILRSVVGRLPTAGPRVPPWPISSSVPCSTPPPGSAPTAPRRCPPASSRRTVSWSA